MSELDDLIAQNKARDKADDDRRYGGDVDPEVEFEASVFRQCPWCRYTFSTTAGINARRTIWIEAAKHFGHLRCWQAFKESQR